MLEFLPRKGKAEHAGFCGILAGASSQLHAATEQATRLAPPCPCWHSHKGVQDFGHSNMFASPLASNAKWGARGFL